MSISHGTLCVLGLVWTASIQLSDARSIDNSQDVITIDSCDALEKHPGLFKLSGDVVEVDDMGDRRTCSLKLKSSPHQKLKITIKSTNKKCQTASEDIEVLNGWLLIEQRLGYFWPRSSSRKWCSTPEGDGESVFELDQNVGEVFYRLEAQEYVILEVSFVAADTICDVLLDNDDIGRNVSVRPHQDDMRCKIRVPGQTVVRIDAQFSPDKQCGSSSLDMKVGRSVFSYNTETICESGVNKVIMPCRYAELDARFSPESAHAAVSVMFYPLNESYETLLKLEYQFC